MTHNPRVGEGVGVAFTTDNPWVGHGRRVMTHPIPGGRVNHRFEPHITVQQFVTKLHHRYQFISRSVAVKCRRGWHHQHGSLWLHFLHSYAIPYQVLMCNVYASTWRQTDVTTTQLPYTSLSLSLFSSSLYLSTIPEHVSLFYCSL